MVLESMHWPKCRTGTLEKAPGGHTSTWDFTSKNSARSSGPPLRSPCWQGWHRGVCLLPMSHSRDSTVFRGWKRK